MYHVFRCCCWFFLICARFQHYATSFNSVQRDWYYMFFGEVFAPLLLCAGEIIAYCALKLSSIVLGNYHPLCFGIIHFTRKLLLFILWEIMIHGASRSIVNCARSVVPIVLRGMVVHHCARLSYRALCFRIIVVYHSVGCSYRCPFAVCAVGGASSSLYCTRASFRARQTWLEVEVVHSTSAGYREITWSQIPASTVTKKR